jgi:hypothetical protein
MRLSRAIPRHVRSHSLSQARSAICLVIDRLSSAYLGALGNTWVRTPAFDRLAAQSVAFDRAMIDSPDPNASYASLWTGMASWQAASANIAPANHALPLWCNRFNLPAILLTDDAGLAAHPLAARFDEVVQLAKPGAGQQAADWQETQFATFIAQAVELLQTHRPPALVWLHASALSHVWDSPQGVRNQYAAEDDPLAAPFCEPPSQVLDRNSDPDLLLGSRHAYAGEISVLDHGLDMLLDTIDGGEWKNALLAVTSIRGYPLGEHGIVGRASEALYGELLRVPLFIRVPDGPQYGAHSQSLAQPADLFATFKDYLTGGMVDGPATTRDSAGRSLPRIAGSRGLHRRLAIARSTSGEIALATPAWFVRSPVCATAQDPSNRVPPSYDRLGQRPIELFVEPDDYFQVNEVADRCVEVVEEFQKIVHAVEAAVFSEEPPPELTLADVLLHGLDAPSSA